MPASVLIVEDDFAARSALAEFFQGEGLSVACASDGLDLLGYLKQHPLPSVLVLDLMMPVMDGMTLLSRLNHEPDLARIPVVVISADPDLGAAKNYPNVVAAFSKPIDTDRLLADSSSDFPEALAPRNLGISSRPLS
jgi:CheY-like chemotaxis protein